MSNIIDGPWPEVWPSTWPGQILETVSGGVTHIFTSADGTITRLLPILDTHPKVLVGNLQGSEVAPGGYDACSGEISKEEYAANPALYVYGSKWKVERDGVVIWSGTLDDPDDSGATVVLKGLGSATAAERNFERALWLSLDTSDWAIADSDPFDYDVDAKQIEAEVKGRELRFKVPRNTQFLRASGETRLNGAVNKDNTTITVYVNTGGLSAGERIHIGNEMKTVAGSYTPGSTYIPLTNPLNNDHPNNTKVYWSANNNPSNWATGLVQWTPTSDIREVLFTAVPSNPNTEYDLEVLAAPSLNDSLTLINSYGLAKGNLSGGKREIDCNIPAGKQLVMVRLKRKSQVKKANRFTVRCKNPSIRGLASNDTYKTHEVVNDLAKRVAPTWDRSGVQVSTQKVGPLDTQGESAATILDDLGALDDWRWLALDEAWEWGPWNTRTWVMTEGRFPRALVPLDRYNAVEIPFRYGGGYVSSKTVTADTYVQGTPKRVHRIELDKPPPEDIATVFAKHIANYLWTVRKGGTAELTWVEATNAPGIEVPAWEVHAGDTLRIGGGSSVQIAAGTYSDFYSDSYGAGSLTIPGRSLRITSKSFTDTTVQVSFDDSHPLLRKLQARRTRSLALGRGQAQATLGQLGLERPKTPEGIVGVFDLMDKRKGRRRYDMVVDWEEVTRDIEEQRTAINSYVLEYRYERPDATKYGRDQRRIKAEGDDDDPNDPIPTRARVKNLLRPHKDRIQFRVWAVDVLGKESTPSVWSTAVKPANWVPSAPTGITYELNRKKLALEFDLNDADETEDDGSPVLDRDVAYVKAKRFKDSGGGWVQQGKTLRLNGTQKTWAVRKPRGVSFKVQLWSVGAYGNTSSMVEVTATRKKPNKPTVRSRRRSPRRLEWVMNPPTTWHDGTSDDFDQDSIEAYDYTVLQNGVVDEDRSDHHRKALNFSAEVPKGSTGWKLRAASKGVDGEDSDQETEATTVNDEALAVSVVTDIDYTNESGKLLGGGGTGTNTALFGNAMVIPSFVGSDNTVYSGGTVPHNAGTDVLRYQALLIEVDRPTTLYLHGLCEWSNDATTGTDYALVMWLAVYIGSQPLLSGVGMTNRTKAASGRDGGFSMRMYSQPAWGRSQLSNMRSVFVNSTGTQDLGIYWEYANSSAAARNLSIYRQRLNVLASYAPDKVSGATALWTPSTTTRTAYLYVEGSD